MQEEQTGSTLQEATRIILEHGLLGEGLDLSELERMRGVNQSMRRWAESGRTLAIKGMLDSARPEHRMRTWMSAIRCADASMMSAILAAGGRDILTLVDSKGRSSLYVAAASGNLDVVRLLLREGGDDLLMHVSIGTSGRRISHKESCLFGAAKKGHVHVVRELLEFAQNARKQNELLMLTTCDGYSCLYAAVAYGHLDVVNELLRVGGRDLAMLPNIWGGGCLTVAAELEHLQIVNAFISWANTYTLIDLLNSQNENGWSALHIAVKLGNLPIVEALFHAHVGRHRANPFGMILEMQFGKSLLLTRAAHSLDGCLHFAARCKRVGLVEVLLPTLMELAGDRARDLLLLTNQRGQSCLSSAINEGNMPVVNALLDAARAEDNLHAGSQVLRQLIMLRDVDGKSCLHFAVEKQHLSIVQALLDAAGDATPELLALVVTRTGNSCLHLAVSAGRVRRSPSGYQANLYMVSALLKAGGRELLMMKNNTGDSCLHLAADDGRWLVMKALLQAGGLELSTLENHAGQNWVRVLITYILAHFRRE